MAAHSTSKKLKLPPTLRRPFCLQPAVGQAVAQQALQQAAVQRHSADTQLQLPAGSKRNKGRLCVDVMH